MKTVIVFTSMVAMALAATTTSRPCEDAPIDCAAKDEEMEICKDPIDSVAYCPRYCGVCQGPTPEPMCHDFDMLCPTLVNSHYCSLDIANQICPKSCGFCGTTPEETTTTPLQFTEIPDPSCQDIDPNCITLLQRHYCGDEEIVRKLCQRSCNMCPTILVPVHGLSTGKPGASTVQPSQGPTTPRVCANYDDSCLEPATVENCTTNDLVQLLCPLACKVCVPITEGTPEVELTTLRPLPSLNTMTVSPLCEDLDPACDQLTQNFFCDTNALLRRICARTCGVCVHTTPVGGGVTIPTSTECKDFDVQCSELVSFCDRTDLLVSRLCRQTCGLCPTVPPTDSFPLMCRACVDPFCEREVESVQQCPEETPYCSSRVINNADGTHGLTKACASKDQCDRGYVGTAAGNTSVCISFNPNQIVQEEFICFFCCTKNECNKHAKPNPDSLYIAA